MTSLINDIPQCWAYNLTGTRCDLHAGHNGNHQVIADWTDAECYEPTNTPKRPAITPQALTEYIEIPGTPAPPAIPQAADTCVACNHKHRNGECNCGCYSFIG